MQLTYVLFSLDVSGEWNRNILITYTQTQSSNGECTKRMIWICPEFIFIPDVIPFVKVLYDHMHSNQSLYNIVELFEALFYDTYYLSSTLLVFSSCVVVRVVLRTRCYTTRLQLPTLLLLGVSDRSSEFRATIHWTRLFIRKSFNNFFSSLSTKCFIYYISVISNYFQI